ncbi:hypothetical protein BDW62DRAFT_201481 [Aspergillus aurantiobrunneus]
MATTTSSPCESPGITYQFGAHSKLLPQELIDTINAYILGGRPDGRHEFGSVPAQLCRVNSHWSRLFTPILYAKYQFNGNLNNIGSLWSFLRTLVQRPGLADLVQELTLTTTETDEPFEPDNAHRIVDFLREYWDEHRGLRRPHPLWGHGHLHPAHDKEFDEFLELLIDNYKSRAFGKEMLKGWCGSAFYSHHRKWLDPVLELFTDDVSTPAKRALARGYAHNSNDSPIFYQTSLTALVIAFCPNLIRLNFDVWGPGEDALFGQVIGLATGRLPLAQIFQNRRPMGKVEVLQLSGREIHLSGDDAYRNSTNISDHKDYWHLPNLKELMVLNAEMVAPLENQTPSAVERLTLHGTLLQPNLFTLLSVTKNLRQLSLIIDADYPDWGIEPRLGPLQYANLWRMIYSLKDQLEYLDLDQEMSHLFPRGSPPVFEIKDKRGEELAPFCPPLRGFSKLRQLNITPLGLHGYNCAHEEGTKFGNHLPPNLESLGLYAHGGEWANDYFQPLDQELESIAIAGSRARGGNLRAIVYDKIGKGPPAQRMDAAAGANGILCEDDKYKYLFFCGIKTTWGSMNHHEVRKHTALKEIRDPGQVIPQGMTVHGYKGRLSRN